MTEQHSRSIISDPIGPLLVRTTVPIALGIASMISVGIIDSWFISLLGTNQLAAASFVIPLYTIYLSLSFGIGAGIDAIASRLTGEGRNDATARYITDSLILALLISVLFAILLGVNINGLFTAIGATADVLPYIRSYMYVLVFALPMTMITFTGSSSLRAVGAITTSAIAMLSVSLLNLILDPLLIFGLGPFPALGIKGAAIASLASAAIVSVYVVYSLAVREKMLLLTLPRWSHLRENWSKLQHIAVPETLLTILAPLAALIMMVMITRHGPEAVAGFGMGLRLESIYLLVLYSLISTLRVVVGQNLGAGREDRSRQTLLICLKFILVFHLVLYVFVFPGSPYIAALFSDEAQVVRVINTFNHTLPLSYGALGVVALIAASMSLYRRPWLGVVISMIRLYALYLPLAYIGARYWGVIGLFSGAAIGNFISAVIAYLIMRRVILLPNGQNNWRAMRPGRGTR